MLWLQNVSYQRVNSVQWLTIHKKPNIYQCNPSWPNINSIAISQVFSWQPVKSLQMRTRSWRSLEDWWPLLDLSDFDGVTWFHGITALNVSGFWSENPDCWNIYKTAKYSLQTRLITELKTLLSAYKQTWKITWNIQFSARTRRHCFNKNRRLLKC